MAAAVLEVMFMKLEFLENAIVVRFKESNVDSSLLWLRFQLLWAPKPLPNGVGVSQTQVPTEKSNRLFTLEASCIKMVTYMIARIF